MKTEQFGNITTILGDCMDYMATLPDNEIKILKSIYNVSDSGIVTRIKDQKVLCSGFDYKGYKRIRLKVPFSKHKDGRKTYKIHRLVAMYHLSDYSNNLQVNHKNGIKSDNRVCNLEMMTNSQNAYHGWNLISNSNRRQMMLSRRNPLTGKFTKAEDQKLF